MSKKIIFITGANGEMGHSLINTLNQQGIFNIVALDIDSPKYAFQVMKFIKGSILDTELLKYINNQYTIDAIYHLAAILSTKAELNPLLANDVNVNGTLNMFELCKKQSENQNKVISFFFPSSIAVYNVLNNQNMIVDECYNKETPITQYGKAKLKCEKMGVDYHNKSHLTGIDFRVIRFPGIISGTSVPTGGTSDYAPEMIHCAAQQKSYECFVEKNRQLPFIVMPDAINAILKFMKVKKNLLNQNIYNITSFNPTVEDFYNKTKEYFPDFNLLFNINDERQKIIDSWPKDINDMRAQNDWGWQPEYNFSCAYQNYIIPEISKKYNLRVA